MEIKSKPSVQAARLIVSKMYDLISIGDSTLDIFLELNEAQVLCDLDKENCIICFHYADKIPVNRITYVYAVGNAANNAIGSARLGLKAAIYTNIGDDTSGKEMLKVFEEEKVDLKYVITDKERGSNLSTVLNYKGERTILVYHEPRNYQLPEDFGPTKWIYYTSVAKNHEQLHQPLAEFVSNSRCNFAFNPGSYQLREGVEILKPLMKLTKVFIVNKDEAKGLVGESTDIKFLLEGLKKYCSGLVVITDGEKGSFVHNGNEFYVCPIFPAHKIEMTGAGDAYATAFLAVLFYGKTAQEAMLWGAINAASVIEKIGAREGLLTKEEIELKIARNPNFVAKEF